MTDATRSASAPMGLLSFDEQRAAALQLTLAMLALGLLGLGLIWRWQSPEQTGVSDLLLGAAAVMVAFPVLRAGWFAVRYPDLHGVTDLLTALAMLGAWATGDLLTAILLPIVMIFGHVLEERSVIGSHEAIASLARMTRTQARRVQADGSIVLMDNSELAKGDRVEVRAGDRIPADGRVISGNASIDTAPITGESVPVEVSAGMDIFGGAINLDGLLQIEVTRIGQESTLGKVIALMQHAESAKPPITRLLERHAGQYLIVVLLIAALTWFVSASASAMLAVLVAACPCALVLSAPATSIAGIAVAARHGILIRGSAFLEELADTTSLIIDKTGTLSSGALRLQECRLEAGVADAWARRLAASLGSASSHPVSRTLAAQVGSAFQIALNTVRERPGLGLVARLAEAGDEGAGEQETGEQGTGEQETGEEVALGRPELFAELQVATSAVPTHDGPIVGLSQGKQFLGWFLLADTLRPEAEVAMRDLRDMGLTRQLLLTGDRASVAQTVAAQVGISEVVAEALPEQKLLQVKAEIAAGFRPMVVGDGINDSLALKAGVVGIAMGVGGSDIALASADVVLIGSDLRRLGTCLRLSRLCRQTLLVNVVIGLGWTVAIVLAAAFGWLGAAGALIAALLHNFSTLVVLANAGRLLRFQELLPRLDDLLDQTDH